MTSREIKRVRNQACDRIFGIAYQLAYAILRSHEDAEDAAVETQARIWKALTKRDDLWRLFHPGADEFLGDRYTRQTAVNVCYDFVRKRVNDRKAIEAVRAVYGIIDEEYRRPNQRQPTYEFEDMLYERSEASTRKRELLVEAALNLSAESQRRRMLYVLVDGLNFAQIAHLEGVSEAAIRRTRDRAMPHMIAWINQWAEHDEDRPTT